VCIKCDAEQLCIRLLEGVCFGITEKKKDERTKNKKERKAPHYQEKKTDLILRIWALGEVCATFAAVTVMPHRA